MKYFEVSLNPTENLGFKGEVAKKRASKEARIRACEVT